MPFTPQTAEPWVPQTYFAYAPSALVLKQETKSQPVTEKQCRERRETQADREWDKRTKPLERQIQPASAAEISFRHSGWSSTRSKVGRALERCSVPVARTERFRQCGSGCMVQRKVGTDQLRLSANYCHDRHCKPCSAAKSAAIARNLARLMEEGEYAHVVLTLKHSDSDLSTQFSRLIEKFAELRRRRLWSDRVEGGAYFFECKRSKDGTAWHPHLHIVIRSSFIPQQSLSAAWLELTGDSSHVWIEAIKSKQKAVRYVAKYASKGLDPSIYHNDDWLDCCVRALHGRRLCSTFGCWRGSELEDEDTDDVRWENVGWLNGLLRLARNGCSGSSAVIQNLQRGRTLGQVDERTRDPAPPPA